METFTAPLIATVVTDHLMGIQRLAREYEVTRLEVYGDAAEGELENARLPINFLVVYPDDYDYGPWGSRYAELKDALTMLLGRDVSLTMDGAVGPTHYPHRLKTIKETRQLLYAAT